jgi:hypothetical protein
MSTFIGSYEICSSFQYCLEKSLSARAAIIGRCDFIQSMIELEFDGSFLIVGPPV